MSSFGASALHFSALSGAAAEALVEGVGKVAKGLSDLAEANAVEDSVALLRGLEDSSPGQEGEMTRDDRKVHRAALGDLADAARAGALGKAREHLQPGRISQRLEEGGVEQPIDGLHPACGLPGTLGVGGLSLHGCASIQPYLCPSMCSVHADDAARLDPREGRR